MRKSREIIGYVRDALVILIIVAAGMYVLNYPEKVVDAFLIWMLRRHWRDGWATSHPRSDSPR